MSKHHPVKIIITHPDSVVSALSAARSCGLPDTAVVLLCRPGSEATEEVKRVSAGFKSLDDLANSFAGHPIPESKKMAPGESRRKLAFLWVLRTQSAWNYAEACLGRKQLFLVWHHRTAEGGFDPALVGRRERVSATLNFINASNAGLTQDGYRIQFKGHWNATLPFTAYDPKTRKGDVVLGCLPL